MKTTSFQFINFLPCCYKCTNQEMYQHKSKERYNCNNRWLIQIMVVNVETIVDQEYGNQLTYLLNLLHRLAMTGVFLVFPLPTFHFTMTKLRMSVFPFPREQSRWAMLPDYVEMPYKRDLLERIPLGIGGSKTSAVKGSERGGIPLNEWQRMRINGAFMGCLESNSDYWKP